MTPYLETSITGFSKSRKHKTNSDSRTINLTTAMTIVFLKETYKTNMYLPISSSLCTKLLPDIRNKEKCCAEMTEIKKIFSNRGKYDIFLSLIFYKNFFYRFLSMYVIKFQLLYNHFTTCL